MNVEMKEQLSALMDGEADRDATRFVLRTAEADPAMRGTWSRYHLARDVLRKQPVMLAGDGFSASLMARIEAEDAAAAAPRGGSVGRWVRYASGGAVAAAVAVVALLASGPNGNRQPAQAAETRIAAAPGAVSPAADLARTVNFSADPILVQSPLVQPASATRSLPGYGYDPRFQQQSPWRHEGFGAQRGGTPYVLLVVPQGESVPQQQRPH